GRLRPPPRVRPHRPRHHLPVAARRDGPGRSLPVGGRASGSRRAVPALRDGTGRRRRADRGARPGPGSERHRLRPLRVLAGRRRRPPRHHRALRARRRPRHGVRRRGAHDEHRHDRGRTGRGGADGHRTPSAQRARRPAPGAAAEGGGRPMSTGALWPYLIAPSTHGNDSQCAVSAKGHRITFADGSEVLDADSGLRNVNLGYGNEAIATAVAQAATHGSYLHSFRFENTYARKAADDLLAVCGTGHYARVLFSSGGGVANDAAMKLVRHYHALRGRPERNLVVALRGSFHGLTFGGFALTGEDLGQRAYGVDQRLIRHITPNDVGELRTLIARSGRQIAAVVVEPVLGTGTVPITDYDLAALVRLRDESGYLLVADEVATGFGRTGTFFASQTWPGQPDVLLSSKGLTNGTVPAS